MIKHDLIIFTGAPGSGKTTVSELLQKDLDSPLIDFGNLRIFHLDREWKKANDREELMSFENLVFILKNYIRNGYKNVIINDLKDDKALKLAKIFSRRKTALVRWSFVMKNYVKGLSTLKGIVVLGTLNVP